MAGGQGRHSKGAVGNAGVGANVEHTLLVQKRRVSSDRTRGRTVIDWHSGTTVEEAGEFPAAFQQRAFGTNVDGSCGRISCKIWNSGFKLLL